MDYLKDLVSLVKRWGLEDLLKKSLNHKKHVNGKPLYDTLYQEILNDNHDEEALRQKIFPGNNAVKHFSNLKYRFFLKASNVIFFLNPENFGNSVYKRNYFLSHKFYILSRFFIQLGGRQAAFYSLNKAFKLADKYELTEIKYLSANALAKEYSFFGEIKAFEKFNNIADQSLKNLQAENELFRHYHELSVYLRNYHSLPQQQLNQLEAYCNKAESYKQEWSTYVVSLYESRLKFLYYSLTYRFDKIIEVWENYDQYIQQNPAFYSPILEGQTLLYRLFASLNLKDFDKGEYYAQKCEERLPRGNIDWFIFNEYYFLLKMHQGYYPKAIEILEEIVNHEKFQKLPSQEQEKWTIFKGYAQFILEANWVPERANEKTTIFKKFRLNKFLNELPVLSRDKAGENTNILILQILIFMARNQWPEIIEREEPLKNYNYRYLKQDPNKRIVIFVRMILKALRKQLDYYETVKATQQDLEKLRALNQIYEGGFKDLELIPFETLWDWMLIQMKASARVPD